MSKAFTKESDSSSAEENESDDAELSALPQGTKNYITPQGAAVLQQELKKLLYTDRPEVVRTVAWAASNGDRSENGDYIYGKRRLREIDRRIRFLQKRLEAAEVIDPEKQSSKQVLFGATVTVQDSAGKNKTYCIVGIDETKPKDGKISWISPIGRALLRSEKGDVVLVKTPRGPEEGEELEVLDIQYRTIE